MHLKSILPLMAAAIAVSAVSSPPAHGGEAENKQLQERILRDMKTKADMDARKQAETYRDKTHDGRLKTGPNTSVSGGLSPQGGSVNLRHKF